MDILLALNLQNSFLNKNGSLYLGEKAEILKIRISSILSLFKGKKLFIKEIHGEKDSFFTSDKTHSIVSTDDCLFDKDLVNFADLKEDKTRYDALFGNNVETIIKQHNTKNVHIIGLETHTSILFTAESLRNKDYEVTVIEPCIMSRSDYLHGAAISIMRHYLGVSFSNG